MGSIESATAYDDVCRTLTVECDDLVIPLINELFGEHFTMDDRIIRRGNEHFQEQQGGAEGKRITDGLLEIVRNSGGAVKKYHIESESSKQDGTILIRVFEYASQIALDDGNVEDAVLTVEFPHSGLIYLRSRKSAADSMEIRLITPGGEVSYEIPVLRIRDYLMDDIFDRRLYFLIPFYLFNYESEMQEIENSALRLEEIKRLYRNTLERLEEETEKGLLSTFSYLTVRDMTNKVAQNLASKYNRIRKGIGDLMGGRVLDFEAKRIRDIARKEGREEGRAEGREEGRAEGREEGRAEGNKEGRVKGERERDNVLYNTISLQISQGISSEDILKGVMTMLQHN